MLKCKTSSHIPPKNKAIGYRLLIYTCYNNPKCSCLIGLKHLKSCNLSVFIFVAVRCFSNNPLAGRSLISRQPGQPAPALGWRASNREGSGSYRLLVVVFVEMVVINWFSIATICPLCLFWYLLFALADLKG